MALTSCCGILTVQVGVIILSVVFLVVAGLVFGVNVFSYTQDENLTWPINLFLVILFVILMIISGALIFMSAYSESRKLASAAMVFIIITTFYWLILTVFSFSNSLRDSRRICVNNHCPESFWLAHFLYRNFSKTDNKSKPDNQTGTNNKKPPPSGNESPPPPPPPPPSPPPKNGTEKPPSKRSADLFGFYVYPRDVLTPIALKLLNDRLFFNLSDGLKVLKYEETNFENLQSSQNSSDTSNSGEKDKENLKEDGDYIFGLPIIGVLLFALTNLLFFLFSIYLMWSYAHSLRDDCCEEITVCESPPPKCSPAGRYCPAPTGCQPPQRHLC